MDETVRIIAVAQRIENILIDAELIYSENLLELLTTLRKLGVVSKEDKSALPSEPNHRSLALIWTALQFSVQKGSLTLVICNYEQDESEEHRSTERGDEHRDVILSVRRLRHAVTPDEFEENLSESSNIFKHTRGMEYFLQHDSLS